MMDFGEALDHLKAGLRVTRAGWNGRGMYVEMQVPDAFSKMKRPYLFMCPVDGDLVPWVASQSDLLANDWDLSDNWVHTQPAAEQETPDTWTVRQHFPEVAP